MSVFESIPSTPPVLLAELPLLDEAQLAAAAFLARYNGRTLQSYRADLRQFFVEYLVVGGLGARAHGATRPTRDVDFVPSSTAENLERLAGLHRLPVGPFDRQPSRTRPRSPPHAAIRIHHGHPRRRSPAARCPSRRPPFRFRVPPPSTTDGARTTTATRPTPPSRSSPAADR